MNRESILDAMGWLDDSLIEEAAKAREKTPKRRTYKRSFTAAACLIAAAGIGFFAYRFRSPKPDLSASSLPSIASNHSGKDRVETNEDTTPPDGGYFTGGTAIDDREGRDPAYTVTWTSEDGHLTFTTDIIYGMRASWWFVEGTYTDNGEEHQVFVENYFNLFPDGSSEQSIDFSMDTPLETQCILAGNYDLSNDGLSFTVTVNYAQQPRDAVEKASVRYFVQSGYRVGDKITFYADKTDMDFQEPFDPSKQPKSLAGMRDTLEFPATLSVKCENGTYVGTLINAYRLTDGSNKMVPAGTEVTLAFTDNCETYYFSGEENKWINTHTFPKQESFAEEKIIFLNKQSFTEEGNSYLLYTDKVIL